LKNFGLYLRFEISRIKNYGRPSSDSHMFFRIGDRILLIGQFPDSEETW